MALENNQIEDLNTNNDEISLKELIIKIKEGYNFLAYKWKIILIAGIIGGVIGLTIALFEKPTYKAVLTFAMEEEKGGGLSGAVGLASSFGIDLGGGGAGGAFATSNLAELMKSRLIIEKVLLNPIIIEGKLTTLAEYYIKINGIRKKWDQKGVLKNVSFFPNQDRLKFSFHQDSILMGIHNTLIDKENLNIMQKDKKVTFLSIEVISGNEKFSKIFCENLAKETSDFYILTKSKKAKINVDVLQRQLDSIRSELNFAISGVASQTDNVYNLNPAFIIKSTPSKKRQIDVQANTAILTNLVVQLELAKITLRKETPLIQLIDIPIYPLEKNKLGKTKGIILGGGIFGFLTVLFLSFNQFYKKLVN